MQAYDYIIIGQGIAGTVISHQLREAGKTVLVINQTNANASSRVAAGIINPITGRKMSLTWRAHDLFPYLWDFYSQLEKQLGIKALHLQEIYRPFLEVVEQNDWMGKSAEDNFKPFVNSVHAPAEEGIHAPYDGLALNQAGWLDLNLLLDTYRDALGVHYREAAFREEDLMLTAEGVEYEGVKAKGIIYAQGYAVGESKYWEGLPFRPVKGEVLTIELDRDFERIYNRGVFALPLGNHRYRVGATYDNHNLNYEVTEQARKTLLEKLEGLVKLSPKVVDQRAGIRPATKDRRPFIGQHPDYPQIFLFGGLGTKGVSLAPFFGEQLKNLLLKGTKIEPEVDIYRFF
ncbi:FAD-binding oxidoreductase [Persicobacter sp. CCB-QB2]|uniref:NAD(P)/FAD-dependent oxidoreductase n=1 Tax=Persicobacter sp. CCB-QB2 TaxID=1561025 RepID=UPI0006A9A545|nr:FAD-dependent oxidoreductase [Persicobacter sp. CCB-QB2]